MSEESKAKVEKIEPFDYGSVNKDHQDAIREVLHSLKEHGLENEQIYRELSKKFNFEESKIYDINQSMFVQCCKRAGLWWSNQGYLQEGDTQYPLVAVQDDTRKLDKIIQAGIEIYQEIQASQNKK